MSSSADQAQKRCPHVATRPAGVYSLKCMDCGETLPMPDYCPPGSTVPTMEQQRKETQG